MKQFLAEIVKVTARKLVSNDMEAQVVFRSNDMGILQLGEWRPEMIVRVTVEDAEADVKIGSGSVKTTPLTVKNYPTETFHSLDNPSPTGEMRPGEWGREEADAQD